MRLPFSIILVLLCLMISHTATANIILPSIFSDNMVLQQQSEVVIWGWAKPQEKVRVLASWEQKPVETITDNQANWSVRVQTPSAGGPYTIELKGYNTIILRDVMIGEVWLCSGQSNMEWTARMGISNAQQEVAQASYPDIRFLTIDHRTAATPQVDVSANTWTTCTPETMEDFSAVAYFFAKNLQQTLKVPIGLINASWGGTPAEAWIAMQHCPERDFVVQAAAQLQDVPWGPEEPGIIYNAMIAPLEKLSIAGVLWYQGEGNAENLSYDPRLYYRIFPLMISSWRNAWGYPFPFYFVQIAPYQNYPSNAGAIIRDAQRHALSLPHTGMVVTSDIGDIEDIHPGNKHDVGLRLANIALSRTYHSYSHYDSGPLYRSHEIQKNKVIVHFDFAEGLYAKDGALTHFEIAGNDSIFYPAEAIVVQDRVVVSSASVPEPIAVRFAWSNSAEPNLYNEANLPASCFRTDDWSR